MRILLVEDETMDSMLIERWVKPHEVIRVRNAANAMSIDRTGIDVIMCDMGLPDATTISANTTTVTEILSELPLPLIKISGAPRPGVVAKTPEALLAALDSLTTT